MGYKNIISGIYKIHFTGYDRVYVGLTNNFNARKFQHTNCLVKGIHFNKHLQCVFNKLGLESLNIDLIEQCSIDILKEREMYYISLYKSFSDGFNMTSGGERFTMSEDVKMRISQSSKGKVLKQETKEKLRAINLGKKQSEQSKINQSIFMKNRKLTIEDRLLLSKAASYKRSDETKKKDVFV